MLFQTCEKVAHGHLQWHPLQNTSEVCNMDTQKRCLEDKKIIPLNKHNNLGCSYCWWFRNPANQLRER